MKAVAEIAIVGLIGTFTIIAGIIIPPSVIKTTIGKELLLTYSFEKAQHGLLSFLSSTQDGKPVYEMVGTNLVIKDSADISKAQNNLNKVMGTSYCIVLNPEVKEAKGTQDAISNAQICEITASFNTIIVVPYNKDSLVRVIGMGVK